MDDLIQTAGDMIANVDFGDVATVIGNAGGFMIKESGKIAVGVLIRPQIEDMIKRFRKAQEDKLIEEGFEATDHGAVLLQVALNALLQGVGPEKAEAVKKVFLGLAMNPVDDSLERMEQLEIMKVASELDMWEIALINALERYSKEVFNKAFADEYSHLASPSKQDMLGRSKMATIDLGDFLKDSFCKGQKRQYFFIEKALSSLRSSSKGVLVDSDINMTFSSNRFVVSRQGTFTDFGWKLVVHLYSATDAFST